MQSHALRELVLKRSELSSRREEIDIAIESRVDAGARCGKCSESEMESMGNAPETANDYAAAPE
jgi:hypothetical protein